MHSTFSLLPGIALLHFLPLLCLACPCNTPVPQVHQLLADDGTFYLQARPVAVTAVQTVQAGGWKLPFLRFRACLFQPLGCSHCFSSNDRKTGAPKKGTTHQSPQDKGQLDRLGALEHVQ